jgi:hypothetical protein
MGVIARMIDEDLEWRRIQIPVANEGRCQQNHDLNKAIDIYSHDGGLV